MVLLSVVASTLYVVRQQTVVIIDVLGNTKRHLVVVYMCVCRLELIKLLRVFSCAFLQSENRCGNEKLRIMFFVTLNVATQYRVNEQNVTDAYYKLMRPEAQIKSYIEDALVHQYQN